jgi:DHA1 family multidrug resistance protein-like MFS transporter
MSGCAGQTSSQKILLQRAKRLRKLTGNSELKSEGENEQAKMSFGQTAKSTLIKPFVLNFSEAVVFANNLFIVRPTVRCFFMICV